MLLRELAVGATNGLVIALVGALVAGVATGDAGIGLVIGLALLGNMIVGGFAGAGIPMLLRRMHLDPALASNIFLTMLTDLVGFGGFLAIAAVLL